MKIKLLFPAIMVLLASHQLFADDGAQLFKTICAACHTVGKGKLVGPDLKGVDSRHSPEWLLKWVKSSQTLVNSGDADAVKLFNDNNKIMMPDQPALSDDQIKSIFAFIKAGGQATSAAPVTATGPDNVTLATQKAAEEASNSGSSLLTMFSFTEYILLFLAGIMLIIIYVMGMAIKSLTEKIKQIQ